MDIDVKPVCCVAGNGLRVGRRYECVLYGVLDLSLCVPASVCDYRMLGVDRQLRLADGWWCLAAQLGVGRDSEDL